MTPDQRNAARQEQPGAFGRFVSGEKVSTRMKAIFRWALLGGAASVLTVGAFAQFRSYDPSTPNLEWQVEPEFKDDVFTFVRIEYNSGGGGRRGWYRGYGGEGRGRWATDYPDSDLNFSYRLQQVTALKVHPEGKVLRLTDPELFDYPFIYIVEPGGLVFEEAEVEALRKYLLNGGFLMVDDFWGAYEWEWFYRQIKRVFPQREPEELPLSHEVFHSVFPISEKPQVPNMQTGHESQYTGVTWERDGREVHYKGIFDEKGRMMVIICHNTDLGDGWERESWSAYYFREFSEKKAYPMGINIVFYAMTH